jgi:hypothetical protein
MSATYHAPRAVALAQGSSSPGAVQQLLPLAWQGTVPEYPWPSHPVSTQSIHSSRRLGMKKNDKDKAPREGRKPFFARLLESQELEQAAGGRLDFTRKYPSDSDEYFTLKYPSDNDECSL